MNAFSSNRFRVDGPITNFNLLSPVSSASALSSSVASASSLSSTTEAALADAPSASPSLSPSKARPSGSSSTSPHPFVQHPSALMRLLASSGMSLEWPEMPLSPRPRPPPPSSSVGIMMMINSAGGGGVPLTSGATSAGTSTLAEGAQEALQTLVLPGEDISGSTRAGTGRRSCVSPLPVHVSIPVRPPSEAYVHSEQHSRLSFTSPRSNGIASEENEGIQKGRRRPGSASRHF